MSERFQASVLRGHQTALAEFVGRLQAGVVVIPTAQELADLGNLAGALNYWAAQPAYPVDEQSMIVAGDYGRKLFTASHEVVTAFPFLMPASGTIYMASSEFQGQPWARLMTISTVAGDMDAQIRSAGKVPDIHLPAGAFPAGTLLYANNVLTEAPIPGSSGSGFSIVW